MPAQKRKGKKLIHVDFTGVEVGGGSKLLDEGPIDLEVDDIEEKESDEGNPYLAFTFKVADGDDKGVKVYDNFSLQPQALWKFRGFLEAAGQTTEDGEMAIDPDELLGLVVTADIVHEDYKGKPKNRVAGYSSVDGSETTDTSKNKDKGGSTVKKKKVGGGDDEPPEWKVKQKVSFKDGKKTLEGVITEIEDDEITVRVGKEEYVMGPSDLEAA